MDRSDAEGRDAGRDRLIIFGKFPRAGRVKTRLAATLGDEHAAELYRAFLLDAVETWSSAGAYDTVLAVDDEADVVAMIRMLSDELHPRGAGGDDNAHTIVDVRVVAQRGASLGARLVNAFDDAFAEGCRRVCAIGSDHPTVPLTMLSSAFDGSQPMTDIVIGPAVDGGYWLIGMHETHRGLLEEMPYSSDGLYEATCARARSLGLTRRDLGSWYDVDTWDDLLVLWKERRTAPPGPRTRQVVERILPEVLGVNGEEP